MQVSIPGHLDFDQQWLLSLNDFPAYLAMLLPQEKTVRGHEHSSVVYMRYMLCMREGLGSIPSTSKKEKKGLLRAES